MPSAKPLTFQVSDLVDWFRNKSLVINEEFQRKSVWNKQANTYLIDTLLTGMPVPKVYIRTKIDPTTQKSVREVVDGQQRIRAMVSFADDELRLTNRSAQFSGKRYSDLTEDQQQAFLGYIITADQLLNASDEVVLEVFARLNSFNVVLSSAEKRHARFQTDFKWAVREASKVWGPTLENAKVLTLKQRARMKDDEFIAEAYRILVEGVQDGGDKNLAKFYEKMTDAEFTQARPSRLRSRLDETLNFIFDNLYDALDSNMRQPYQILAMFAAYQFHKRDIPANSHLRVPSRQKIEKPSVIIERLNDLSEAIDQDPPPKGFQNYIKETLRTSPQRIAARKVRFLEMVRIFAAE